MNRDKKSNCRDRYSSHYAPNKWHRRDTTWMLSLFGTAVGAGTLFLPITLGLGGFWPLLILSMLAFPMTFYAHRGMTRFVLSGKDESDITDVVEEHFGPRIGTLITLLYFLAIFPVLLMYSVALTNTVDSFIGRQLLLTPPPRPILALILVISLLMVVRYGEIFIVKAMSIIVYPFIVALLFLTIYLIPYWSGGILNATDTILEPASFIKTFWVAIPVIVFSFNHSPIISAFAIDQKRNYGTQADIHSSKILFFAHILMVFVVLFFVFSCVLTLSTSQLAEARSQNISILSYLASQFENPLIASSAQIIAFVAIAKSFLGHYIGAREGLRGLILKTSTRTLSKSLDKKISLFMLLTCWIVATINPSIIKMIETLGGPIIAAILFIMPMYAIKRITAMQKYSGAISNYFVTIIGVIAISSLIYSIVN